MRRRARRGARGVPPARARRPRRPLRKRDGDRCQAGEEIAEVVGSARALLVGERTALNFLQRLSGIATRARRFVDAAGGRIVVLDTRKTTPRLRVLEKYAVRAGGATNHRAGLFDAVLIKDNHIRLAGGVAEAVARMRESRPGHADRDRSAESGRGRRRARRRRGDPARRQHVHRRHSRGRRRARAAARRSRSPAASRSSGCPSWPPPAPTSSRSARSRIRRRPSISALRSNPSEPLPPDLAEAIARARDRLHGLGSTIFFFPTIGSTNDVALTLAAQGDRDRAVVIADEQTARPRPSRPRLVLAAGQRPLRLDRADAGPRARRSRARDDAPDAGGGGGAGRRRSRRRRRCASTSSGRTICSSHAGSSPAFSREAVPGGRRARHVASRRARLRHQRGTDGVSARAPRSRHVARDRAGPPDRSRGGLRRNADGRCAPLRRICWTAGSMLFSTRGAPARPAAAAHASNGRPRPVHRPA